MRWALWIVAGVGAVLWLVVGVLWLEEHTTYGQPIESVAAAAAAGLTAVTAVAAAMAASTSAAAARTAQIALARHDLMAPLAYPIDFPGQGWTWACKSYAERPLSDVRLAWRVNGRSMSKKVDSLSDVIWRVPVVPSGQPIADIVEALTDVTFTWTDHHGVRWRIESPTVTGPAQATNHFPYSNGITEPGPMKMASPQWSQPVAI